MPVADPLRLVPRRRAITIIDKIHDKIKCPNRTFRDHKEEFEYEQLMYRRIKRIDRWWHNGFSAKNN
jgi:hypothetical protein